MYTFLAYVCTCLSPSSVCVRVKLMRALLLLLLLLITLFPVVLPFSLFAFQAEQCLKREKERVSHYLHASSEAKLQEVSGHLTRLHSSRTQVTHPGGYCYRPTLFASLRMQVCDADSVSPTAVMHRSVPIVCTELSWTTPRATLSVDEMAEQDC